MYAKLWKVNCLGHYHYPHHFHYPSLFLLKFPCHKLIILQIWENFVQNWVVRSRQHNLINFVGFIFSFAPRRKKRKGDKLRCKFEIYSKMYFMYRICVVKLSKLDFTKKFPCHSKSSKTFVVFQMIVSNFYPIFYYYYFWNLPTFIW